MPTTRGHPSRGPGLQGMKFENHHQVGGIRLGTLDAPSTTQAVRVAFVDTGSGLRFTVALDRGGDIVDASYNRHNLAYLTANGYRPPNHAYHVGEEWLTGWPGGLVTTCGPRYIGAQRNEDGNNLGLHGHHSNTPTQLGAIVNPDPARGLEAFSLAMTIRDSSMFRPVLEVRRVISGTLGVSEIHITDTVTNLGNQRTAHNWLYHVNLGFPLLDVGSRHFYRGRKTSSWNVNDDGKPMSKAQQEKLKVVPPPLPSDAGAGGRIVLLDAAPDAKGLCHVGLINRRIGLGFELEYPAADLPRFANWQHYGPAGSYVSGIEPYFGSLWGKEREKHPLAAQFLDPGQERSYRLTVRIHERAALGILAKHDGPILG